jgi:threonylcarbamoyladenosine tRNA methylthiotransferase MtaB
MPQVNGKAIKIRAAALREAGETQVQHHLQAQVGKTHQILMENPNMGRTEQFTEVSFAAPQAEGQIVSATILRAHNKQLIA